MQIIKMMIKNSNFESIRRLLAFIFLLSAVAVCLFNPYGVVASGSIDLSVNVPKEEIATFDEAEKAALDVEPTEAVSPLLHAEHYRASVYFPERQKRSVTSHEWMRAIPFIALIMLALAATRLFGRRREKSSLDFKSAEGHVND
jgi:hypothetical protein